MYKYCTPVTGAEFSISIPSACGPFSPSLMVEGYFAGGIVEIEPGTFH